MKVSEMFSYVNGLEYLTVRQAALWAEIHEAVSITQWHCSTNLRPFEISPTHEFDIAALRNMFVDKLMESGWGHFGNDWFEKRRVAVHFFPQQISSHALDTASEGVAIYLSDDIDVGIEILPVSSLQSRMGGGAYFEHARANLSCGRGRLPAIPLVLVGVSA